MEAGTMADVSDSNLENITWGTTSRRNRRRFLRDAGLATLPYLVGGHLLAEQPRPGNLIPREKNPDNLEFPFDTLSSLITPNDLFYLRNHFPAPTAREDNWRPQSASPVQHPLLLT